MPDQTQPSASRGWGVRIAYRHWLGAVDATGFRVARAQEDAHAYETRDEALHYLEGLHRAGYPAQVEELFTESVPA